MLVEWGTGAVVDEENGVVLGIAQGFDFVDGGVNLRLRLGVFRAGVVANVAFVHRGEEAVGAEELGEVFAGGEAALLVEMEQRGLARHHGAIFISLHVKLVVGAGDGVAAQHLKEAGIELVVVTHEMIVEPELIVHLRLCPDVVGEEVAILLVVCLEHITEVTLPAVGAAGGSAVIPDADVGEEVVGHLGQTVHVDGSLVLVTNLVTGSPSVSGIGGDALNDGLERTVVVVTAGPAAGHVAGGNADGKTVHAIVVLVGGGIFAVLARIGIDAAGGIIEGGIQRVGSSHTFGTFQTHGQVLRPNDAVPAFKEVSDANTTVAALIGGEVIVSTFMYCAVFVDRFFKIELEDDAFADDGDVVKHVTGCEVVPVFLIVALGGFVVDGASVGIECIAHFVVVTVDVTALDVNLEVRIVGKGMGALVGLAVPCFHGVGGVVDAGPLLVHKTGNHVETLLELHAIGGVARLSVSGVAAEVERSTFLDFAVHHYI